MRRPDASILLALAAAQMPTWLFLSWRGADAATIGWRFAAAALQVIVAAGAVGLLQRPARAVASSDLDVAPTRREDEAEAGRLQATLVMRQRAEAALSDTGGSAHRREDGADATGTQQRTADELSRAAIRVISETTTASVAAEDVRRDLNAVVETGREFLETLTRIGAHAASSASMGVEAAGKTESTTTNVDELLNASQRIAEMTGIVASIARQTNLLALNATIEAARAGEHGRGFAVVAGEVKSLAAESARAAASIADMANLIYGSTERTIGAIRAISGSIASLNEATNAIAVAVEERVRAAASMTERVGRVATNIDHVASAIVRIEAAADETIQGAGFIRVGAADLAARMNAIESRFEHCVGALKTIAEPEPPIRTPSGLSDRLAPSHAERVR